MPVDPWINWDWLSTHVHLFLAALQEHVILTLIAVGVALAISLPLGVIAHRWHALRNPVLTVFWIFYTTPPIALFSRLVPYTGLGTLTAEIGLVGYAVLILVRNVVVGLEAVPADILDAANGMGYRAIARLLRGGGRLRARRRPIVSCGTAAVTALGADGLNVDARQCAALVPRSFALERVGRHSDTPRSAHSAIGRMRVDRSVDRPPNRHSPRPLRPVRQLGHQRFQRRARGAVVRHPRDRISGLRPGRPSHHHLAHRAGHSTDGHQQLRRPARGRRRHQGSS